MKITGKVVYRHGMETGVQPYIEISTTSKRLRRQNEMGLESGTDL